MDATRIARMYRGLEFNVFPLSHCAKEPLQGISLRRVNNVSFDKDHNIGMFAGSKNGLVIIDADSSESQRFVLDYLVRSGIYDWTTVVRTPRRGGLHFWLRIHGVPDSAQAYYKLPKEVGGGELRVKRPAYVVAPPSALPEGEYVFEQGNPEFFVKQPSFPWLWLSWLMPKERLLSAMLTRVSTSELAVPKQQRTYYKEPMALKLLDSMEAGDAVHKVDFFTGKEMQETFSSNSEAEFALVLGLILAGWSFDDIRTLFDQRMPKHYSKVANKTSYLVRTYNNVVGRMT